MMTSYEPALILTDAPAHHELSITVTPAPTFTPFSSRDHPPRAPPNRTPSPVPAPS